MHNALQAPLTNTIGDFWRMVVQCQSPSIVNLTQDIENENLKCVMYWPQHAGSFNTYDKIFVNTKRVEHQENFVIYTIEALPEGCSNSHIVKLIHMPTWPDKGMPPSGRHVLRLIKRIVEHKSELGPIIVHCSAGVGRSACIVLIDVILRYLFNGEHVEAKCPSAYKEKTQKFIDDFKSHAMRVGA
ncbi:Protein-tyrosine phosphatase [Cooperia oncophora]